ncbi:MAG: VC0807 family protein [Pseudobdellovibrionaceae bacterium]
MSDEIKTPVLKPAAKPENPFLNILFNIVVPIMILNKGGAYLGAVNSLLLAMAFPLFYGAYDLWRTKKPNFISLLGLINVAFSGGFSLMHIEGIWFAVKEAAFPLLIGSFVLISAFGKKPFLHTMFLNPQMINLELVNSRLIERNQEGAFKDLIKQSTIYLSGSFLLSAILNFVLAFFIFIPIDLNIDTETRQNMVNAQLGEMTKYSFVVILVPSLVSLGLVLWHFLSRLSSMTGLPKEQILNGEAHSKK